MKTTIDELFTIVYGQREYHNKEWLEETKGGNLLISSKGTDNGAYGFFDIPAKYKAPFITVQGYGTIGHAFVQEQDCSVDDHMLILIPKQKIKLDELYQVAYQIRLTKWKYKYGRGITPSRLSSQRIVLHDFGRDWNKFEKLITPAKPERVHLEPPSEIKILKVNELFEVKKGKGSYLEKLSEGNVPVISTQDSDNGICGYYDIEPTFEKGSITIGRIMCNPHVQLNNFATVPDDMYVLVPLSKFPLDFLFYVSSIIRKQKWRFNYSRKVTKGKLEGIEIPLPIKGGELDFDYTKSVANNSYGYSVIGSNT